MKRLLLLLTAIAVSTLMYAAYFENLPKTLKQPDNTKFECFVSGDEFFNRYHDEKGFTIIRGEDGYFCYAEKVDGKITASKYRVGSVDPLSVGISPNVIITPEEYQEKRDRYFAPVTLERNERPSDDHINNLVIFISFSDQTEFTTPISEYQAVFNDTLGRSLRDYYREAAYGQLEITSTFYPAPAGGTTVSYQDTNPRGYFMEYDSSTNPDGYTSENQKTMREHDLLRDAVNAVSSQIPSDLDLDYNNDNLVDNVCFIIRGDHEGWSDLLWAHRWSLFSHNVTINNKRVYDYTFQPEPQAELTTLCHEMFHVLSAPDLYHYNYDGFSPTGPWDLMSSGRGHMMAYMKYRYGGWIDNIPTISSGTHTLYPLTSAANNCFRINCEYDNNEYFIVEYRSDLSATYEQNIPQSGLLVYRINTRHDGEGNAYGGDEVYVYRFNGTPNDDGEVYNAVLSTSVNRTEIHNTTNPYMFLSDGLQAGVHIVNVADYGDSVTFVLNPSTSSINGTISLDSDLGSVSDVELRIGQHNVPVQQDGSYTVDLYTGSYELTAELNGFTTHTATLAVQPDQSLVESFTMNVLPYPVQITTSIEDVYLRFDWTDSSPLLSTFLNYSGMLQLNGSEEIYISSISNNYYRIPLAAIQSIRLRVNAVYSNGESFYSEVISWNPVSSTGDDNIEKFETKLVSNYPNPFNPETTIKYSLADKGNVKVDIYNIIGQKVKSFEKGVQSAGVHELTWKGTNSVNNPVASGMYYYRLNVNGRTKDIKKMMLLK